VRGPAHGSGKEPTPSHPGTRAILGRVVSQSPTQKPTGLVIKLPYGSIDEFAVKFRPNLSDGGMFVRTKEPRPRGTELHFKIELGDGSLALHGKAISRWVRLEADENGPAGMAVEFLHLEPEGRALINRMLGRGAPAPSAPPPQPLRATPIPAPPPDAPNPFASVPGAPTAEELFSGISGLHPAPEKPVDLEADLFGDLNPSAEPGEGATFTDPEVFELLNAKK